MIEDLKELFKIAMLSLLFNQLIIALRVLTSVFLGILAQEKINLYIYFLNLKS